MKTEVDSHRLMYHPKRVSDWLDGSVVYPIYVEMGLTNKCNHRCIFCALDWIERNKTEISREVVLETLEDMANHGVKSIMFAGEGESLIHKDVSSFVRCAKEHGIDVAITTNGILFDKKKANEILQHLSWIRFSVDAGSPESYSKIHITKEADFNIVMSNIKYAAELKKEKGYAATIGVQAVLIPQNVKELMKLAKKAKEIGADNIQIKPYSHHPSSKNKFCVDYKIMDSLEKDLQRFDDDNFQVFCRADSMKRISEGVTYPECLGLPFFALIDSKGNVMPCNLYYGNEEFCYGNLYDQKFSQIWEGKKREEVMSKIKKMGTKNCRRGCRLDADNRYLYDLKNPHPHVNFI